MSAASSWGPFRPDLDPVERKASLRLLRGCVRLLTGPRGDEVGHRLLVAEIDGHESTLAEAESEFDKLAGLDKRRILSSFAEINFAKPSAGA